MNKAEMKDSFERIIQEADGAFLWESDELPFIEDWELVDDPHFILEMEHVIDNNRLSIAAAQRRKTPRKLSRELKRKKRKTHTGKA